MNRKKDYADMERFARTCAAQNRRYYRKTAFRYSSRPWTDKEDDLVLQHNMTDTEISQLICRSVGAIQKRRWALKNQIMKGDSTCDT